MALFACGIERLRAARYGTEEEKMKGYYIGHGYMGLVEGAYMLFASEEEYLEYLED